MEGSMVLTVIVWKDKGKNPLNDAIDRGRFLAMAKRCEVEVKDGQHIILTITPQGDVREVMNDHPQNAHPHPPGRVGD
jgi:hypothetical protein